VDCGSPLNRLGRPGVLVGCLLLNDEIDSSLFCDYSGGAGYGDEIGARSGTGVASSSSAPSPIATATAATDCTYSDE